MPHGPSEDQMQNLFAALQAQMMVGCYGPSLRLIATELPGKAVCALLQPTGDGITRVVYDPNKPHSLPHTRAMLRNWWMGDEAEPVPPPLQPDVVEFLMSCDWRPGAVPLEHSDEGAVGVGQ